MSTEIKVPEAGESIAEVYIARWHKAPGDPVTEGEALVELETDKASMDVPAPVSGRVDRLLKEAGAAAGVGEVIAYIEAGAAGEPESRHEEEPSGERPGAEATGRMERADPWPARPSGAPVSRVGAPEHLTPSARRAAAEAAAEAADASGGPGAFPSGEPVPGTHTAERRDVPERREETAPMSPIRQRIAQRLVEVQQTAALLTTFNEVDMSGVAALRQEYREIFEETHDVRLGLMSFFVAAAVDALRRVPEVNAQIRGTDIVYRDYYDIGIAVGGGRGLVVPVLRNAQEMSFAEIEGAIADFAQRARENRLQLEELQGGTFTITNGGVYGSLLSTPIVNPPQSGILGLHKIEDRPVAQDGQVVIRPMMYVALTYDHRIVDGREAVTFLRRVKEAVEAPARMLLDT